MVKAKKILGWLIILTIAAALYYIVSNIIASFVYFTSFPWWSAFAFALYYFGPVLLVELIAYVVLRHMLKK